MTAGPRIDVVTIFPELVEHFLSGSLLGQARKTGLVDVRVTDLREFTTDRHHSVDDTPYGGGDGMVLRPEPVVAAVEALKQPGARVFALCPKGRRFDQALARELAAAPQIVLLAGRYAGFDDRIFALTGAEPLSIGDYVLAGGELAALVVTEAVTRLVPGVVGNPVSAEADSFSGPSLEHPLFTRPREFRGLSVPEVLLSGDHAEIARWREREADKVTRDRRPDLLVSSGVKR